jgi:leader peptidase (prepilin peptidase)/N-methyltransferase
MAWRFGYSAQLAFALVFGWAMIALAFIDFDTQLLPDDITLPVLWLGLIANCFGDVHGPSLGGARRGRRLPVLWLVYWAFRLVAKKEGMGSATSSCSRRSARGPAGRCSRSAILAPRGWAPWWARSSCGFRDGRRHAHPVRPVPRARGIVSLLWGREIVVAWLGRFPA